MPTAKTLLSASLAATCAPAAPSTPKASKSKSWLDVASFPAVRAAGGDLTATAELEALLQGLEKGPPDRASAAASAFAKLDAADVDAFALALAEAWVRARGPVDATWVVSASARIGGRATIRAFALWARKFARERAVPAALLVVDALANVASDAALVELRKLEHAPKDVADAAEKHAKRICEERGLDRDDVDDLIVPECSLGAGEALDFGARAFRVDFDADFTPVVRDAAGDRLASLPRIAKKDDPEKAARATERWNDLKTLLRDTLRSETKRLEWAMCAERRWSSERFLSSIVGHPLLARIAQRLLWVVDVDGALTHFRIAEDKTLADAADAVLTLPPGAEVLLPHALHLGPDVRATWGSVFADYAIIAPFAQIGRETFTPTEAERQSTVLERFRDVEFADKARYPLEGYGWIEDEDYHEQVRFTHVLPDGTEAFANLGAKWERDGPRKVYVQASRKLGEMEPVSFSELCRDIARLPRP